MRDYDECLNHLQIIQWKSADCSAGYHLCIEETIRDPRLTPEGILIKSKTRKRNCGSGKTETELLEKG